MRHGLFITGTDTGIGKTTVGTALISVMVAQGARVRALKPVESGCERSDDGTLLPADAVRLRQASSFPTALLEDVVRYRLAEPLAPAVAGERAGIPVDPAECVALARRAEEDADWVVAEGAGGLLVPLAGTAEIGYLTVADFIAELGYPALVVARAGLGTLNHTLLTVNELKRRKIPCLGVVLNRNVAGVGPEIEDNARVLTAMGVRVLGEIPFLGEAPDPEMKIRFQAAITAVWNRISEKFKQAGME